MTNLKNAFWVEKYRPKNVEEYIFHDLSQKSKVLEMIQSQEIPHILLSGIQGSGKTSLSFILINELNVDESDVLILNASDENSVDTVRDKIKSFVSTSPMGNFKIVLLEEADYLTHNGQGALRRLMEEYAETARFILTCNYEYKLVPAILSRCTVKFRFKAPDRNDIAEYLIKVLAAEKVVFDLDLLDRYIAVGYPDIRTCLSNIQQHVVNGVLTAPMYEISNTDYKFTLIELIEQDKWNEARQLICENVVKEEYEDIYKFLYDNINKSLKFQATDKYEEAIIIIAEHLYKHSFCADSEINAAAMLIRLGMV